MIESDAFRSHSSSWKFQIEFSFKFGASHLEFWKLHQFAWACIVIGFLQV